jgi:tubulin polyglutamylase TTLL9
MQIAESDLDNEASNDGFTQIGRSQGKGIFLFRAIGDIADWSDQSNQPEAYIVQRYIHNPLLIGHKKFDMRIYVLVVSHNPLQIYLYRSGFGRFTHYRYDPNDIFNTGTDSFM